MRLLSALPILLAGAALLGAAGCKRDPAAGAKVGLLLANGALPYDQALRTAVQEAAGDRKLELIVEDAKGDPTAQAQLLGSLLEKRVKAVIVQPVDPAALTGPAQKAASSGVFLVAVEQPVAGVEVNCFVRSNAELAGQLAADYIGHRFPGGGKAALLLAGQSEAQNTVRQGFQDYLKEEHEKIQLAGSETAADPAAQRQAAEKLLAGNPQAIFATSDTAALAAAEAVKARGSKCVVVGYGGLPETVEAVKSGKSPLQMTIGPFPQRVGRFSTRQVVNMLKDDEITQRAEVPVFPVTKDNYGTYPAWTEPIPRDLPIPWDSDLTLDMRRE